MSEERTGLKLYYPIKSLHGDLLAGVDLDEVYLEDENYDRISLGQLIVAIKVALDEKDKNEKD